MGIYDSPEMPMGLGIALCKNPIAMNKYTSMSDKQKRTVIDRTHAINSKEEMETYVHSLTENQISM